MARRGVRTVGWPQRTAGAGRGTGRPPDRAGLVLAAVNESTAEVNYLLTNATTASLSEVLAVAFRRWAVEHAYRRTAQTFGRKQGPSQVDRAKTVLAGLERRLGRPAEAVRSGRVWRLGAAPRGDRWRLPGDRERVRYEHPQGRRVNALATNEPLAPPPTGRRSARADAHVRQPTHYLRDRSPAADMPREVVLDDAGIRTGRAVEADCHGLAKLGIFLYDLRAYSPERSRIEPEFQPSISRRSVSCMEPLR